MRRNTWILRLALIACVAVVLCLGASAVALADDIYVSAFMGDDLLGDGSVADPYASIGKALTTATAGDDIHVGWGVYNEDIDLVSGVDILGSGTGLGTHVVGTGTRPTIEASSVGTITVDGISVSGGLDEDGGGARVLDSEMTFSHVTFSSNNATATGGGLYAESSVLTLADCVFEDNTAANGGGLGSRGCTLTVTGTSFERNVGTGVGAGGAYVELWLDEDVLFESCTFTENTAGEDGGGLWLFDDHTTGSVIVTGTVFTDNHAANDGGGLFIEDSLGVVSRCDFISNTSEDDGGGAMGEGGVAVLWSWCTFTDNEADESGGGLVSETASATIADSTFTGNIAGHNGGGIDLYENSTEVLRCTITDNSANGWEGGGVNVETCCYEVYRFEECTISGNDAPESGGGLFFGIFDDYNVFEFIDCTISGNTSYDGGGVGIYIDDEENEFVFEGTSISDNAASEDGGGLFLDNDDYDYIYFWFTECTITGNEAGDSGGGLDMEGYDCCDEIYLTDSLIASNTAGGRGGGVRLQNWDVIDVDGCTVADNQAFEGGGLWLDYADVFGDTLVTGNVASDSGGGIYLDSRSDVWDSTISGNSAVYGGGICFDSHVDVWDSTISGNAATYGGGLYGDSGNLEMDDSRVAENAAMQGGGFYLDRPDTRIDGVTFFGNHADEGGASYNTTETPGDVFSIVNSIFDSNEASTTGSALFTNGAPYFVNNTVVKNRVTDSPWSGALWVETGPGPDVANCIFYDNIWDMELLPFQLTINTLSDWWAGGPGSFSGDPEFRDFDGGDYRLLPTSPCIDSGATTPTPGVTAPSDDFVGEARPQDGDGDMVALWDMGAFEQPVQTAPVSIDDTFTVAEDTLLWPAAPGVLSNDFDINGDPLTASFVTTPANGGFGMSPNGRFVFTPDPDWNGTTTFTYRSYDGMVYSAPATVTIIVTPVNDPPVSNEDTATCAEDGTATVDVLANDSDPADMDSLTATLTAQPASGTVVMDASGNATYTPDADFNGTDMFWYQAFDGTDYGDVTTVTITVTPVNDAPVAVDDAWSTEEDTWFWAPDAGVLVNDFDIDSPAASLTVDIASISPTTNAGWNMNLDGSSLGYLPLPADWSGTFTATYRIFDGALYSEYATVTITVTPVNDAPRSSEDATGCAEDTFATLNVLTNDVEVDGDSMTASLVTPPSNGSVTLDASGAATYTPDADWFGTDYFYYQASDDATESATGAVTTVTVTVSPVNDAPVANPDSYTTDEDVLLSVTLPGPPGGVIDNDSDVESDTVWWYPQAMPTNGTLIPMTPFGEFTYQPDPDWYGTDTFTYRLQETSTFETHWSNVTTVTITVNPVNDAPVSVEDTYTVEEDGLLIVPAPGVIQNDYDVEDDPLTAQLTSDATSGTLVFAETGALVYMPDADWYGTEICAYRVFDGELWSMDATIAITVTPVQDAPVSEDDTATCAEDGMAVFDVLANDTDADPLDVLTAQVWSDPDHGTVDLDTSGIATYTPDADWYGTDTFVYRTFDGTEYSALALVSITVTPVNDAPVALSDHYETTESTTLTVPAPGVLDNDYDIDSTTLTASITVPPAHGSSTSTLEGGFEFLPDPGFWGTDSFVYVTSDGATISAPATVTIDVLDVTPPVTTSDATWKYFGVACVSFSATDTASGVAATYYSLDGGPAVEATAVCTDLLGYHELAFWSVDIAGNVEDPTTVEFELEAALTDYETVAGANRYATAVEASKQSFPGTTTVVIIATGENWPDALGGAALAGVKDAPILLSMGDALPAEVVAEIGRLGASEAYVLGGPGALADSVRGELVGLGLSVTRLGGADRYATARLIAEEAVGAQGPSFDGSAFVCAGLNFPDALAAGAASAEMGWPIYLSPHNAIGDVNLQHMVDNDIDDVIILGGPVAVGVPVEERLQTTFGPANVQRIAGPNRYETAIDVASWTVDTTSLIWDGTAFATGEIFPDALAAGPMQARLGSVLMLTGRTTLSAELETFLIGKREIIDTVRFIGGDAAIAPSVRFRIAEALR